MDARAKKLCDKIIGEARARAAEIITEAEDAARAEIELAEAEAQKRASEFLGKARAAAERECQSLISMGQLDLRNKELALKQELIGSVFDEALEKLKAMPSEEYTRLVSSIILRLRPQGQADLLVAEADQERLSEAAVRTLNTELGAEGLGTVKFTGYTDTIEAGFVLRQGDVAFNFSFADILSDLRETMEGEVAAVLFGQ